MKATRPDLFDRLTALADPTRSRILAVLVAQELTVSEIATIMQLPQSTTSRHLRTLSDEGWVTSRAEGTTRWYAVAPDLDAPARRLWTVVREEIAGRPPAIQDAQRLRGVLRHRRAASQRFFSTAAREWDRTRAELFGVHGDVPALLALLDPAWTVGDLGCGTGQVAELVAPFVQRVIGVDAAGAMLAQARARLHDLTNVDLRSGELDALPVADRELDVALLVLVLHYLPDPPAVLAEVRRVLRPGGQLLVTDIMPHARTDLRLSPGHVWQGVSREQLDGWLAAVGFTASRYVPLPADPAARGPALFTATARAPRRARPSRRPAPIGAPVAVPR